MTLLATPSIVLLASGGELNPGTILVSSVVSDFVSRSDLKLATARPVHIRSSPDHALWFGRYLCGWWLESLRGLSGM